MPTGTVFARCPFDQSDVADVLKDAIKCWGTDEAPIIRELCTMNNEQRQFAADCYNQSYGSKLIDDLKDELGGNFENTACALLMKPREYDAYELHRAITGAGTDETPLIEIMCTRSNDEIEEIKAIYKEQYENELEEDMAGDTSKTFGRLMQCLCTGAREGNDYAEEELAAEDAQKFYDSGEARWGTDELDLLKVLCVRSRAQLCRTFDKFEELAGHPIEASIENETSGVTQEGFKAIVEYNRDVYRFFARMAKKAMKGLGTNDDDLIRIIVSRSEVDLEDIKAAYFDMYETTLYDDVASECSGDYKRMILSIIEPSNMESLLAD